MHNRYTLAKNTKNTVTAAMQVEYNTAVAIIKPEKQTRNNIQIPGI